MAYIGRQLVRGQNRVLDDISSSFNGSTTAFNLTVSSSSSPPASVNQLWIILGGILQKPGTDFTVADAVITFTTAPASTLSFWGMIQGDTSDINSPADASVTPSKIANSGDFAFPADVRFNDADGSHYVGLQAPSTVSSNLVWTLPAADGSANQLLKTDGSGALGWASDTQSNLLDEDNMSSNSATQPASQQSIKAYADTKAVLTGSTNNTVCTVTGANAFQGEATLTFDGANLGITAANDTAKLTFLRTGTTIGGVIHTRDESGSKGLTYTAQDGNSAVPQHCFQTNDGSAITERFRITHDGTIHVNSADSASGGRLYAASSAMYIQSGNGRQTFKVSDGASGVNRTWEITTDGNLKAPDTKGIDFSASSNQAGVFTGGETLTDYEAGTYTPNLLAHGGSWVTVTLSSGSKYGSYVKIGNMVHVQAYFTDFHVDSAHDGDLVGITLPIVADSGSTGYSALTTVHANCFVSGKQTNFFVIANNSNAYGIQEGSTSYDTWKGDASRYLMVAGTYRAG